MNEILNSAQFRCDVSFAASPNLKLDFCFFKEARKGFWKLINMSKQINTEILPLKSLKQIVAKLLTGLFKFHLRQLMTSYALPW